jgi:hypothetical protein
MSVPLEGGCLERLYGLPEQADLGGVLICHGSPLSDIQSFAPDPQDGDEEMLNGESERTILFGHSHRQSRRRDRTTRS